ncbi:MAG: hypothetical protein KatS3mg010_1465 [Acidimicrobiia bacterium]|nr:MAG: hypothetical protein KatS3mg010_1465 [Acidimicrobiia bacterium]
MSCDETSPWSRCHASEPDGASSAASDSSGSLIWCCAFSAALRSANSCSAASALAATNGSTPSTAIQAPRRFVNGPSAAVRVCSSTRCAAAAASRLSVVTMP